MENTGCIIARPINGISLNGCEYLLDQSGEIQIFRDKNSAVDFLTQHGYTVDDLDYLRFLDYQKFQNNIFEDL